MSFFFFFFDPGPPLPIVGTSFNNKKIGRMYFKIQMTKDKLKQLNEELGLGDIRLKIVSSIDRRLFWWKKKIREFRVLTTI